MPRISALQQKIRAAATDEIPAVDTENGGTKKLDIAMIMPTGAVLDYAGSVAPEGFLLCFGQTLNASTSPQYLPLYQAIGNLYGGSSLNDFKLPDARGRVIAGADNMGGTAANRITSAALGAAAVLGAAGGSQSHKHKGYADGDGLGNGDLRAVIGSAAGQAETINFQALNAVNPNTGAGLGNGTYTVAGSNQGSKGFSHYTKVVGYTSDNSSLQPTLILNKIIKY